MGAILARFPGHIDICLGIKIYSNIQGGRKNGRAGKTSNFKSRDI